MTNTNIIKFVLILFVVLSLANCKSNKSIEGESSAKLMQEKATTALETLSSRVGEASYLSANLKIQIQSLGQEIPLTGNLYMKYNDVIRLQFSALGLMEVARMEFTRDSVLVVDRINKQYVRAKYDEMSFLSANKLGFNALQSLFWNELYISKNPVDNTLNDAVSNNFSTTAEGTSQNGEINITMQQGSLFYTWTVDPFAVIIKNVVVKGIKEDMDGSLSWSYSDFSPFLNRLFPKKNNITFVTESFSATLNITLSDIDENSNWEPRTIVSSRYKQVSADDIMKQIMSL